MEVCTGEKRNESQIKMEYMCMNGREDGVMARMQGVEVGKVNELKYLG